MWRKQKTEDFEIGDLVHCPHVSLLGVVTARTDTQLRISGSTNTLWVDVFKCKRVLEYPVVTDTTIEGIKNLASAQSLSDFLKTCKIVKYGKI